MRVFWRRGFHATSIADLTAMLGIGSGSPHAVFGSKDGLYARVLKSYCEGLVAALERDLRAGSDIRTALRRWLLAVAAAVSADPECGCLLVNTTTERY
jgi:TetR/AcrR family transcriptional repressor of nem operon